MRKGNNGSDMFEQCLIRGVAAIHYDPIERIDLSGFEEAELPPEWSELEKSQSGSLRKFAWRIKGGDIIYVAESYPSRIVGMGRVRGSDKHPAYRYDSRTPILDDENHPWRHLLDVEWEEDFSPVRYPNPHCAQATVLDLNAVELRKIKGLIGPDRTKPYAKRSSHSQPPREESADARIQQRELQDWAYTRYTTADIRVIQRRHVQLCNQFTKWLVQTRNTGYRVERRNIDLSFTDNGLRYLVEFKIAYSGDAKPAIREALGQILEYNHYPPRIAHDRWILVTDCRPNESDFLFLRRLRSFGLPLSFGWPENRHFEFSEDCPLRIPPAVFAPSAEI